MYWVLIKGTRSRSRVVISLLLVNILARCDCWSLKSLLSIISFACYHERSIFGSATSPLFVLRGVHHVNFGIGSLVIHPFLAIDDTLTSLRLLSGHLLW